MDRLSSKILELRQFLFLGVEFELLGVRLALGCEQAFGCANGEACRMPLASCLRQKNGEEQMPAAAAHEIA